MIRLTKDLDSGKINGVVAISRITLNACAEETGHKAGS
jgi:hypothetical protein